MSTAPQPDNSTTQSQKPAPRRRYPRRPKAQPQAPTELNSPRAGKEKSAKSANAPGQAPRVMRTGVAILSAPAPSSTVQPGKVISKPNKNQREGTVAAGAGRSTSSNFQQIPSSKPSIAQARFSALSAQQISAESSSKPVPIFKNIKVRKPLVLLPPSDKDAEKAARRLQEVKKRRAEAKEKKKDDHFNLVRSAAEATIAALRKHGISCAVFGSLACKLYGNFRFPKDVDLLVLQPPSSDPGTPLRDAEQIKVLILNTNPRHFYLKLPRDPTAPYRILYYRTEYLKADCKVDILIPGTMHLPNIPAPPLLPPGMSVRGSTFAANISSPAPLSFTSGASLGPLATNSIPPSPRNQIITISGIPLVPFSLLLLHKLQGWADHRVAPEDHKRRRHVQDAADVRRLLAMEEMMEELRQSQPWNDTELFSEEFQGLTRERVKEYCQEFPTRAEPWELLGFETV